MPFSFISYRLIENLVTQTQPLNTSLTYTQRGKKNAYLYFQQALCRGPIHAVHDVIIDQSRFINDNDLGTDIYKPGTKGKRDIEAALRIDCHLDGGNPDILMARNFPERRSAKFNDMAFATVIARLDRDNPQFSGVPDIQFLIEGKLIRKVVSGILQTTWEYSNNPAWVLLDYLTDAVGGKSIAVDEIDLDSFELAAAVCDIIVQPNAVVSGKIFQSTDGLRNIQTRNIPLYECNIILDPKKPIRENVEAILATMGDARLVWTGGKYRLIVHYPESNEDIDYALELTDDNIILDQEISVAWPTASERLNHCIVRFSNESENFGEDSVSWPPKLEPSIPQTLTVKVGLGGFRYPFGTHSNGWPEEWKTAYILNNYSVWNGNNYTTSLEYLISFPKEYAGSCTIEFATDNSGSYQLRDYETNALITSDSVADNKTLKQKTVSLGDSEEDIVYKLLITATDTSGESSVDKGSRTKGRGAALRILQGGVILWHTRELSYLDYVERTYSNAVYRQMIEEDGGVELETEIYSEGITDYYHALAKAEELVRTSRGAYGLELKYKIKDVFLEPGDFIKLNSKTLNIGVSTPAFFRVASTKVENDFICTLNLTRFDYTFLAWNMKDDEYVLPTPTFDVGIPKIRELLYRYPTDLQVQTSSGTLEWEHTEYSDLESYILYVHLSGDGFNQDNFPIFSEIGRTAENFFILPLLAGTSAFFGIRIVSKTGKLSEMTICNLNIIDDFTTQVPAIVLPYYFTPSEIILDPHFQNIGSKQYWWWHENFDTYVELSDIGGVDGGVLRITGNATEPAVSVYANRPVTAPYLAVTGDKFLITIRFKIAAITNSNARLTIACYTTDENWPDGPYVDEILNEEILELELAGYPLDQWVENIIVATVSNNPPSQPQKPYVGFRIYSQNFTSGVVEIDTVDAIKVSSTILLPPSSEGKVLLDDGSFGALESGLYIHSVPTLLKTLPGNLAIWNSAMSKNGRTLAISSSNLLYIFTDLNFKAYVVKTLPYNILKIAISDDGFVVVVSNYLADYEGNSETFEGWGRINLFARQNLTDAWTIEEDVMYNLEGIGNDLFDEGIYNNPGFGYNIEISAKNNLVFIGAFDNYAALTILVYTNVTNWQYTGYEELFRIQLPEEYGPFLTAVSMSVSETGSIVAVSAAKQGPDLETPNFGTPQWYAIIIDGYNWSNITEVFFPFDDFELTYTSSSTQFIHYYEENQVKYFPSTDAYLKLNKEGNKLIVVDPREISLFKDQVFNSETWPKRGAIHLYERKIDLENNTSWVKTRSIHAYKYFRLAEMFDSDFQKVFATAQTTDDNGTDFLMLEIDLHSGTYRNVSEYIENVSIHPYEAVNLHMSNENEICVNLFMKGVLLFNPDIWSNKKTYEKLIYINETGLNIEV
jgi:hypothetical protein